MIQVRKNVFETNSSSTHSMVMCNQSEYDKWVKGELYYCCWFPIKAKSLKKDSDFYTKEEVKEICDLNGILFNPIEDDEYNERTEYFITYDEFCSDEYLEVDEASYTTSNGEKVHTVCRYGFDN